MTTTSTTTPSPAPTGPDRAEGGAGRHYRWRARLPALRRSRPPSLGLGDPVTLAAPRAGERVLDLGSGPGRDLLAVAGAVGPTGRAIGVDLVPEMCARARQAAAAAGVTNVEVHEGDLTHVPLPDASVDAVISNCVLNLVPDKSLAFAEARRVLAPGGRLAILDLAFAGPPLGLLRRLPARLGGCLASSPLQVEEYEAVVRGAGFEGVRVEPRPGRVWAVARRFRLPTAVAVTATAPHG